MNTADTIRAQSRKDPEQLEHEIDQQRDHIGEIVQALEGKLSPGELFASVMRHGKDGGGEFASNLTQTIKANPVPTLLAAAGLAWLASAQRHPHPATTMDTTGAGTGSHLRERASEKYDSAKEHLGQAKARVGESAHGAMDSMRHGAQRANTGFHHMLEDNPMAVGAMGIAIGAMLGALLPATRKENELMGGTRDHLADKAKQTMEKGFDKAAEAGREVTTPSTGAAASPAPQTTTSSGMSAMTAGAAPGTSPGAPSGRAH